MIDIVDQLSVGYFNDVLYHKHQIAVIVEDGSVKEILLEKGEERKAYSMND